jgi:flagellar hook-length control protein FliK
MLPPLPPPLNPPRPSLEPAPVAAQRRPTHSASNRAASLFRESLNKALAHDSRPERSTRQNRLESRRAPINSEVADSNSHDETHDQPLAVENDALRDDAELHSDVDARADTDRAHSSGDETSAAAAQEPGSEEVAHQQPDAAQDAQPEGAVDARSSSGADVENLNAADQSQRIADSGEHFAEASPSAAVQSLPIYATSVSATRTDAASVQGQPVVPAQPAPIGSQLSTGPSDPAVELPALAAAAPPDSDALAPPAPAVDPGPRVDSLDFSNSAPIQPTVPSSAFASPNSLERADSLPPASPHLAGPIPAAEALLNASDVPATKRPESESQSDPQHQRRSPTAAPTSDRRIFAFPKAEALFSPAAARAAQVDVAVRLENATGMAAPQDATIMRAVQLPTGAHSNQGHGFAAQGDTPLPSSALHTGFEDDRFSSRIVRGLNAMLNQRGGVMLMRLDPPELGQLRVQMTIQRGIVTAQFDASTPEARALLDKSMAVLRTALESHGLTVERLTVNHAPASTPGAWSDDRSGANPQQHSSRHDAGGGQSRGRHDDQTTRSEPAAPADEEFATRFDSLTSSAA